MFAPAAAIGGNLLDSPSVLSLILLVVVVLHTCESGVNVGLREGGWVGVCREACGGLTAVARYHGVHP